MKPNMQDKKQIPRSACQRRQARDDSSFLTRSFVICAIVLMATCSVDAQAPEPMPLAHGSVPGEPHHHLKIENEYVRAYYVEVPPHEATQLHQHDHDYIYVSLGPADVVSAVPNKPDVHLTLKDGDIHFSRGGFAHVARNLSDAPFRNVTIELLKPQGAPRNLCLMVIDAPLGPCHAEHLSGSVLDKKETPVFETDEIKIHLVQIGSHSFSIGAVPKLPRLLIALTGAFLQVEAGGLPASPIRPGEMAWFPAGVSSRISSADNFAIGSSYLQIEFKNVAGEAKP